MKDPTKQQEFDDFWDEMAGKPKSTIDPEAVRKISAKFDEQFRESLKKESSQ